MERWVQKNLRPHMITGRGFVCDGICLLKRSGQAQAEGFKESNKRNSGPESSTQQTMSDPGLNIFSSFLDDDHGRLSTTCPLSNVHHPTC
jgi:hypothetical protein